MSADLEQRIGRLEAIEAIRALKARYADVCDTGYNPERMRPMFTADAIWDGGDRFGRYDGFDEVYGFFAGVSSQITWALHYMVAPLIEVAPDLESATGSWYLWQPCTLVTDSGPEAVWLTGRYEDRYRLEGNDWKFSEVRLDVQTLSPFEAGWVKQPFLGE